VIALDQPRLRDLLDGAFAPDGVASLSVQPSRYRSSFPLDEITVLLRTGGVARLIRKNLAHAALSDQAARAKPVATHDPLREIEMYRAVLPVELGTARYVTSDVDPAADRYDLLIEHVPGIELYQVGDVEGWCDAAAWLARMHERLAPLLGSAATSGARLPQLDADIWRAVAERAIARHANSPRVAAIAQRHAQVVALLESAPPRIIHGDAYASNILLVRDAPQPRVCAVDWENAAIGPALLDLATLLAGWPQRHADRIAAAYRDALPPGSSWSRDPAAFTSTLAACTVQIALQLLASDPQWQPPSAHRKDWLRIAEAALGRLP
jgi:hypothetical protein